MKKILLAAALLMSCGSVSVYAQQQGAPQQAASAVSLPIGSHIPAADMDFIATDRKHYTLQNQVTKKGLIVMFSCNTCPFVIKSQARTKEVMEYAQKNGIGMVIVNSNTAQRTGDDSFEAMINYALKQGYTVPYLLDEGKLVKTFGASRTPEVYLFNQEGTLVYKGAMEDNPADPGKSTKMYLKSAIDNMVAGKAINPNTTRSVGCSIKQGS
ncbi:thioredoxin family protein [Chitinophagaceae bacterium MMS25-I14]